MAINLKKENYNDNTDTDTAETVCPEQDSEENTDEIYYPRQVFPENYGVPEIYPRKKTSAENYYPKQAFPENYDVSENYSVQSVQSENTAVSYNNPVKNVSANTGQAAGAYPAAPKPNKKKLKLAAYPELYFPLALVFLISLRLLVLDIYDKVDTVKAKPVPHSDYISAPVIPIYVVSDEYAADEVDEIVIEGALCDISVSKSDESDDSMIHVSAKHESGYVTDITDKILTVSVSCSNVSGVVDISLPEVYEGSVTVNAKEESNISCSAGKDIRVTAESGKVKFHGLDGSSAGVSINSGNIAFNSCILNSCDLYAGHGDISIWNSSVSEKCTASTNGIIYTNSSEFFSGLEASGCADLKMSSFDGSTSLTAADGYIKGEEIDFEDIYIKARNSTVNISTSASSADYTAVLNSDENSTARYEPSAPSGQGSNRIKLDLADSEAYFTFGD